MSYWVGGSGNWSDAANHWAATSGGAPGAGNLPDSTKDAIFDAASNPTAYTVTVDGTATCKDLNFSAAPSVSGTITFTGTNRTVNVYGHVTLLAGMNFTFTNNLQLLGAVTHNFTSNGVAITSATQIANSTVGGSMVLQDALNMSNVGSNVNIYAGNFDSQGFNITTGYFLISATGTITLGASIVTLNVPTGSAAWTCPAGATFSGASSEIVINAPLGSFAGGGKTYGTVRWTAYGYTAASISGANTFATLSIIGNAAKTNEMRLAANQTVTGTLTLTGNSAINRLFFRSDTPGTARTVTAAAVALTNVDFMDITGAGAAAPFTGTSMGDCLGNSGITMDASVQQTATGTASFTWSTHGWTTRVPLPQDDVVIPNAFVAGRRITLDMPRLGRNITCTCTGGAEFFLSHNGSYIFGSLTLNSGVVPISGSQNPVFAGRSACTLTSAGFIWSVGLNIQMPGGKLTLQDAFTSTLGSLGASITYGEFDLNGFTATFAGRVSTSTGAPTLTFGNGTLIVNSTGADPLGFSWTNGTISAANGTLKVGQPRTQGIQSLNLGAFNYGTVWVSGTNYGPVHINGVGAGLAVGTLKSDNPNCHIFFTGGQTVTIGAWDVNGAAPGSDKYINFIGANANGNNVTTPDSATADITGDIAIVVRALLNDWSNGTQMFVSKMQSSGQYSYQFYLESNGAPVFRYSTTGSDLVQTGAGATAVPFADQAYGWLAVTRNATTGDVKYWTSSDGSSWSQLGSTRSTTAGNMFSSTSLVEVGSQLNGLAGYYANGRFRRVMIFNGIPPMLGGSASASPVLDCNAADYTSGRTWVAATGETWTMNGAAVVLADNLIHVGSTTDAAHNLVKSGSGLVSASNLSVRRSAATPASTWYAAGSSVDQGNNSGWNFDRTAMADLFDEDDLASMYAYLWQPSIGSLLRGAVSSRGPLRGVVPNAGLSGSVSTPTIVGRG